MGKFEMMDGEEDSEGGNTHIITPTTPTKNKSQAYVHLNKTLRANQGHMGKKFTVPDTEDRLRAVLFVVLLQEQLEIMIEVARFYASNRARVSEGNIGELAETLISELTMFILPEKMLSTKVMIRQVYSKQEMMEKKIGQFECMQIELENRERKSSKEQMEEVHTPLPYQITLLSQPTLLGVEILQKHRHHSMLQRW